MRDVYVNTKFCILGTNNYYWAIEIVMLPTMLTVIFITLVPVYVYKYEVTYVFHLVKIMKKRGSSETKTSQDFQFDACVC